MFKFEIARSKSDFIATLTYKTAEEGGRKAPAKTGYNRATLIAAGSTIDFLTSILVIFKEGLILHQ
ncbi:hypothetical protein LPB86_16925 [Pedobacter sp. MC2016-14]|uniref:hypothetical protein n=1 Tax=Pedobacter sp. MC2016-14 TaxID=2897327 RepID=UPI001E3EF890|nr:hypothetical protein [Pedobacter sp. MC2016-14]MCD0489928.1 hypothetical protein [Pedobacter sp. MC2016-14]